VYEQLGERNEYVRARGFDVLQQEQMVLTYVERHGRINRAGAADLCQLSPAQATTLLRRMRDAGTLDLRGEKRGSHYILAGSPDTE
jgi:ATP-dependent DNA helicase RecG